MSSDYSNKNVDLTFQQLSFQNQAADVRAKSGQLKSNIQNFSQEAQIKITARLKELEDLTIDRRSNLRSLSDVGRQARKLEIESYKNEIKDLKNLQNKMIKLEKTIDKTDHEEDVLEISNVAEQAYKIFNEFSEKNLPKNAADEQQFSLIKDTNAEIIHKLNTIRFSLGVRASKLDQQQQKKIADLAIGTIGGLLDLPVGASHPKYLKTLAKVDQAIKAIESKPPEKDEANVEACNALIARANKMITVNQSLKVDRNDECLALTLDIIDIIDEDLELKELQKIIEKFEDDNSIMFRMSVEKDVAQLEERINKIKGKIIFLGPGQAKSLLEETVRLMEGRKNEMQNKLKNATSAPEIRKIEKAYDQLELDVKKAEDDIQVALQKAPKNIALKNIGFVEGTEYLPQAFKEKFQNELKQQKEILKSSNELEKLTAAIKKTDQLIEEHNKMKDLYTEAKKKIKTAKQHLEAEKISELTTKLEEATTAAEIQAILNMLK